MDLHEKYAKLTVKLLNKGYVQLGQGKHGIVFQIPKSKDIIKVFRNDDCYVHFLNVISRYKTNVHFPKIIKYAPILGKTFEGLHIIRMEKLEKLSPYIASDLAADMYIVISANIRPTTESIERSKNTVEKLRNRNDFLYETCIILADNLKNSTCKVDIHPQNIMQRSDNTVVIIDPYYK